MDIRKAFVHNRAEHSSEDVTGCFVAPPNLDKLARVRGVRPIVLEGSRGSGKTTLLRFFSYKTQLSKRKPVIETQDLSHVGILLRADTQYLRTFEGPEYSDQEWSRFFDHYLAMSIGSEICDMIGLLNSTTERAERFGQLGELRFDSLRDHDPLFPNEFSEITRYCDRSRRKLTSFLLNPEMQNTTPPVCFSARGFITELLEILRSDLDYLSNSCFQVYIDEYENLLPYQQRLINTSIKHSEFPLSFNIAVKRFGMSTRETLGTEGLQERHDFTRLSVEDDLLGDAFPTFAGELLFERILRIGYPRAKLQVRLEDVNADDEETLIRRRTPGYSTHIRSAARKILPGLSGKELCSYILKDEALLRQLRNRISQGLKRHGSGLTPEVFIRPSIPEASIVSAAILHQEIGDKTPERILKEMDLLSASKTNKFVQGEWIHNYMYGCIFQLWHGLKRPSLAYSGFDAFIKMSKKNARHFLELCHWSADAIDKTSICDIDTFSFDPLIQAEAAQRTARELMKEVSGSGDFGQRLQHFARALGQIFAEKQKSIRQSEPECSHFSISNGPATGNISILLVEAVKWSILFDAPETKLKANKFEGIEYQFNPIFAAEFGISYSKGRRTEFLLEELETLFSADEGRITKFIRRTEGSIGASPIQSELEL